MSKFYANLLAWTNFY